MQNGIHQLNASYDSLQDRIRFCFTTQDGNEFRFWFTRRYLGLLFKTMGDIAAQYAMANVSGDITSRQAAAELAQMQTLNQTDTSTPYTGGSYFPLGEEPILLSKIVVKQDGAGNVTLGLLPENGQGADIGLNEPLVHLIADLLAKTALIAEWQLSLSSLVAPVMGATSGSVRLH